MTEKEKMLAGEFYQAFDKELVEERNYAKKLCHKFNMTDPSEQEKKIEILKKLFRTDKSCWIEPPFYCDYGYNIKIGENFYANHGCIILDVNEVKIGNNVLLAPGVKISTATHPIDPVERAKGNEYALPIEIGDNVWIGAGAIIVPGVKIGANTVIGAGSVVTKDIPENVVAVGNPCKVIRKI
ncbi:sugar O-acetyltransferase [Clostridium ganghwense]|nr:sugar O-acetyltransferase [Clostridium ganghwense]